MMIKAPRKIDWPTGHLSSNKLAECEQGFTYIELIVVVLVVAILAAYVATQPGTTTSLSAEALADMIRTDIRRMQGLAMKESTACEMRFSATQCTATKGGSDYTGGHFPLNFASLPEFSQICIQPDVTLRFNSRGQPVGGGGNLLSSNVIIQLTTGGSVQKTLSVIATTGQVEIH
ncbi:MAG: prepilin-type N-terminal cleavage/methylation domain-containing protein [Deltaproteobacteria bacterium]|nr:prepilin-type N-terminal cleavage/methylation domain-containing protein [Deltaproteobacteria bacterium]